MATANLRSELNCPICLSIFKDPVTLRCGHNFCQACISASLDSQESSQVYTCPQCRKRFGVRPALPKNVTLCNITQYFHPSESEEDSTAVFCSYCMHGQTLAVTTCLTCDAPMCGVHLDLHSKAEEHVFVKSTSSPDPRKCPVHKKVLQAFCHDGVGVCICCMLEGVEAGPSGSQLERLCETVLRQEQLKNVTKELHSVKDQNDKKVQSLQEHGKRVQKKATFLADSAATLFRDMRAKLEDLEKTVLEEIRRQEHQSLNSTSESLQKLQMEQDTLVSKIIYIEDMCKVTDPLTILQGWRSDCSQFCDNEENEDRNVEEDLKLEDLDEGIISAMVHSMLTRIMSDIKCKFHVPEASDLAINASTAGRFVKISGDLKTISEGKIHPETTETPEIFDAFQAFSTRSFSSGKHYWEVQASNSGCWRVGVAYSSVDRKEEIFFGDDNKSWALCLYENEELSEKQYSVSHDNADKDISVSCQRFGIYLDYEAGRLSFYELCDPIRHLHTFTATFTEPLHAAFHTFDSWLKIAN
ncbi:nuclear factor 7, brain-like [Hyperolius riggenbachi]|uniref:nuclear factor 7, brain-like n=1 Tax=Hyperolius riggenbachi TaxID=752182 RepID=UPI0035A2D998